MMKKINVNVLMEVEITDEEYEKLRSMAFGDERTIGNPYNDIQVPKWLKDKIKDNGKIVDNTGTISAYEWITTPYDEYLY